MRVAIPTKSHLIREFRTFSGHTPVALRKECEPHSDLFADFKS